MKKMIIGNQAIAYGALAAGVHVVAGYPGTPSSEVLTELLKYAQNNREAPYVEWSVNEKVAFEIAAGAAWTGKRALAAMKMSGVNVAADSILSVAYSGTRGGLVLYIADDPGAEAGMPEQDTRVFALWAGLPVLETSSPEQAYHHCGRCMVLLHVRRLQECCNHRHRTVRLDHFGPGDHPDRSNQRLRRLWKRFKNRQDPGKT